MVENNTTNRLSTAHKEAILMAMSARPGENLKKTTEKTAAKKKKEKTYMLLIIQTNIGFSPSNSRSSKFLFLIEVGRYHWITTLNTERHKITRNIGI